MQETKFIISGRFERPNGHIMRDELAYISASKEDAISTCKRLYPNFHIQTVHACTPCRSSIRWNYVHRNLGGL